MVRDGGCCVCGRPARIARGLRFTVSRSQIAGRTLSDWSTANRCKSAGWATARGNRRQNPSADRNGEDDEDGGGETQSLSGRAGSRGRTASCTSAVLGALPGRYR